MKMIVSDESWLVRVQNTSPVRIMAKQNILISRWWVFNTSFLFFQMTFTVSILRVSRSFNVAFTLRNFDIIGLRRYLTCQGVVIGEDFSLSNRKKATFGRNLKLLNVKKNPQPASKLSSIHMLSSKVSYMLNTITSGSIVDKF